MKRVCQTFQRNLPETGKKNIKTMTLVSTVVPTAPHRGPDRTHVLKTSTRDPHHHPRRQRVVLTTTHVNACSDKFSPNQHAASVFSPPPTTSTPALPQERITSRALPRGSVHVAWFLSSKFFNPAASQKSRACWVEAFGPEALGRQYWSPASSFTELVVFPDVELLHSRARVAFANMPSVFCSTSLNLCALAS